jgi:hypothetical protein
MILVDGNPSQRISDLHHVSTVIKGGAVFRPAALERALGIQPASARP